MGLIRAGDLDRRVTILRAGVVDDGFASTDTPPIEIGRRSAAKVDVSDRERFAAGQQGAAITTRFRMRSDSLTRTITTADLLAEGDATYTISAVKEIGRREGVEISAARKD